MAGGRNLPAKARSRAASYRRASFPWYKLTFVCRGNPPSVGGAQRREVVLFPDLTVLWVIFFVLVLTILLDRLLLRPLQRVMAQREEATGRRARWRSGRHSRLARRQRSSSGRQRRRAPKSTSRWTRCAGRRRLNAQRSSRRPGRRRSRKSLPPPRNCKLIQRKHAGAWRQTPKRSARPRPSASSVVAHPDRFLRQFTGARNKTEDAYPPRQIAGSHSAPAARGAGVDKCRRVRPGA